jgi:hypothetical protein
MTRHIVTPGTILILACAGLAAANHVGAENSVGMYLALKRAGVLPFQETK